MRLERALPEDAGDLEKFFEQFSLKSSVELKLRRQQGFFAPYERQSSEHETLLLREKDQSIHGIASFIYRETFFQDSIRKIAIATDLRILPSRKSVLRWSQYFLPVLRESMQNHGVSCVFSAINSYDTAAMNAFVRPKQMRRNLPRYHLYRKFQLVSLHGRFPGAPTPLAGLRIRRGEDRLLGPLLDYLKKRAAYRAFTSTWDEKSFFAKIARLPGFRLEDFWIAFDSSEQVVGCMAPWSPASSQEYCPLTYSLQAHNFRQFLKFGRLFRWTRPMTKPWTRTGEEAPLKFRFLTFLSVDNEDIFESLLWHAFDGIAKDEFLTYAHCNGDFRLNPPLSWVSAQMPFGLYAILPPEGETPTFLHPTQTLNPEIEACYFF